MTKWVSSSNFVTLKWAKVPNPGLKLFLKCWQWRLATVLDVKLGQGLVKFKLWGFWERFGRICACSFLLLVFFLCCLRRLERSQFSLANQEIWILENTFMLNEINPCHLKLASYWALERVYQTWPGELLQSPGAKLFQAFFKFLRKEELEKPTNLVVRESTATLAFCLIKTYINDNNNYLHIIATSIMTQF